MFNLKKLIKKSEKTGQDKQIRLTDPDKFLFTCGLSLEDEAAMQQAWAKFTMEMPPEKKP